MSGKAIKSNPARGVLKVMKQSGAIMKKYSGTVDLDTPAAQELIKSYFDDGYIVEFNPEDPVAFLEWNGNRAKTGQKQGKNGGMSMHKQANNMLTNNNRSMASMDEQELNALLARYGYTLQQACKSICTLTEAALPAAEVKKYLDRNGRLPQATTGLLRMFFLYVDDKRGNGDASTLTQ